MYDFNNITLRKSKNFGFAVMLTEEKLHLQVKSKAKGKGPQAQGQGNGNAINLSST